MDQDKCLVIGRGKYPWSDSEALACQSCLTLKEQDLENRSEEDEALGLLDREVLICCGVVSSSVVVCLRETTLCERSADGSGIDLTAGRSSTSLMMGPEGTI